NLGSEYTPRLSLILDIRRPQSDILGLKLDMGRPNWTRGVPNWTRLFWNWTGRHPSWTHLWSNWTGGKANESGVDPYFIAFRPNGISKGLEGPLD
ncbi:MAG TPA: hypothetical protein VKP30_04545, partial [Polyangiaceae bacterium]|nr:hypothetical protein [Polyangiaceae bacterium]